MNTQLDASGEKFRDVDFSEAHLFFPCPRNLSRNVIFEAWGITLLTSRIWGKPLIKRPPVNFDCTTDDIYISGYATIEMEGVRGGSIQVSLYQPNRTPGTLYQTKAGSELIVSYRWPDDTIDASIEEYPLSGVLDWPYGNCTISLFASGPCTIQFSLDDCIPASEYVKHPHHYAYQRSASIPRPLAEPDSVRKVNVP